MASRTTAGPTQIVEGIVAAACERTGLDDFGSDSFREGLELLVRSVATASVTKPEIREQMYGAYADALVNRLRLTDHVRRHPEVADEEIRRPLFILGMPRSGTSVLSYLLDQDPARRSLLLWEAWDSVPPPTSATLRTDPRAVALRRAQEQEIADDPRVRPHHEWADGPTECIRLHQQDFKALGWEAFVPVRDYSRWLMTADMTSAYEYQRQALQVLQSQAPGTWSLKMPSHSLHIEWLVKVFPDARLVWTHRDPFRAVGSLFSMKSGKWERFCGDAGIDWLREHYVRQLAEHVNRPMRLRERIGHDRIYDFHYADAMRDPLGEIRRLYAWAGDELTPETEAAMAGWLERNPPAALGRHEYTLDQFGLTVDDLRPSFADYLDAYDVEPEGR